MLKVLDFEIFYVDSGFDDDCAFFTPIRFFCSLRHSSSNFDLFICLYS